MTHEQLRATTERIFLDVIELHNRLIASDSQCKKLDRLIEIVEIYLLELGRFKGEVTGEA